jgi:hypothetical protein
VTSSQWLSGQWKEVVVPAAGAGNLRNGQFPLLLISFAKPTNIPEM